MTGISVPADLGVMDQGPDAVAAANRRGGRGTGDPVLRVEPDDAGATVCTADQSWRAPVVIVAAGA